MIGTLFGESHVYIRVIQEAPMKIIVKIFVIPFLIALNVGQAADSLWIGSARALFHFNLDNYPTDSTSALWPSDSPLATLKLKRSDKTRFFFSNAFLETPTLANKVLPLPSHFDIYDGFSGNPRLEKFDDSTYLASNNLGTICRTRVRYTNPSDPNTGVVTSRSPFANITCDTTGDFQAVWLQNIYDHGSDTLLGFLHIETTPHGQAYAFPAYYSMGLAISTDEGKSWTFLGEILKAKNKSLVPIQHSDSTPLMPNLGGAIYLVIQDAGINYLYLYYSEFDVCNGEPYSICRYNLPLCPTRRWIRSPNSVARARLDSVYSHAVLGNTGINLWKKYDSSTGWTQDAFTGMGTEVLRSSGDSNRVFGTLHGDAVKHSGPNGSEYFLVVPTHPTCGAEGWGATIFRSSNGIDWSVAKTVASVNTGNLHSPSTYPTFVSDHPVTRDGLVVGDRFDVYFSDMAGGDPYRYKYYKRRIKVGPNN
jgi:hypothetical protein